MLIQLKNGLRVLLKKNKALKSMIIGFSIECGAFYPYSQKCGVAHMLEHNILCDKNHENSIDVALGKIGTYVEANTMDFNTIYSVRTFNKYSGYCIELVMDKLFNAKFDYDLFQNEKKIIHEEYLKQRNNVMPMNAFMAAEKYYSGTMIENCGYGIGTPKQINDIQFYEMKKFYEDNYLLTNTTVIVLGNFSISKVLCEIRKHSRKYKDSKKHTAFCETDIQFNNNKDIVVSSKECDLMSSCVELVFSGVNELSKDKWAYRILGVMLSGLSTSSIIKKKLRKELGYIYNCDAALDSSICYKNCGTFSIRYFVDNSHIEDSILEVFKCLLAKSDDYKSIFEFAKECTKNNIKIKSENLDSLLDLHSTSLMITNKPFNLKGELRTISKISYLDIVCCIQNILSKRISVSVLGKKIDGNELTKKIELVLSEKRS